MSDFGNVAQDFGEGMGMATPSYGGFKQSAGVKMGSGGISQFEQMPRRASTPVGNKMQVGGGGFKSAGGQTSQPSSMGFSGFSGGGGGQWKSAGAAEQQGGNRAAAAGSQQKSKFAAVTTQGQIRRPVAAPAQQPPSQTFRPKQAPSPVPTPAKTTNHQVLQNQLQQQEDEQPTTLKIATYQAPPAGEESNLKYEVQNLKLETEQIQKTFQARLEATFNGIHEKNIQSDDRLAKLEQRMEKLEKMIASLSMAGNQQAAAPEALNEMRLDLDQAILIAREAMERTRQFYGTVNAAEGLTMHRFLEGDVIMQEEDIPAERQAVKGEKLRLSFPFRQGREINGNKDYLWARCYHIDTTNANVVEYWVRLFDIDSTECMFDSLSLV